MDDSSETVVPTKQSSDLSDIDTRDVEEIMPKGVIKPKDNNNNNNNVEGHPPPRQF